MNAKNNKNNKRHANNKPSSAKPVPAAATTAARASSASVQAVAGRTTAATATTTSTATTAATTTVTRRRVVDKVRVGRKTPWWPLLLLPLIPATVAATGFNGDNGKTTVVAAADTTLALDTAVPAETVAATEAAATEAAVETTVVAVATEPPTTVAAVPVTEAAAPRLTVVEAAASNPRLGKLSAALAAGGLTEALQGPGPFTVFAPSDDALASLDPATLEALLRSENKEALAKVLRYHVVPKRLEAIDLVPGDYATVDGATVTLAGDGAGLTIADSAGASSVSVPGIGADNGIVYVIDRLLVPPGFNLPGATNDAGDAVLEDLTVYFDSNSSALNAAGQAKVDKAVAILQRLPKGTKVSLVGHADSRGSAAANLAISDRRTQTVLGGLQAGLGESAGNIEFTTAYKGEADATADLEKSRRVTVEIQQ